MTNISFESPVYICRTTAKCYHNAVCRLEVLAVFIMTIISFESPVYMCPATAETLSCVQSKRSGEGTTGMIRCRTDRENVIELIIYT